MPLNSGGQYFSNPAQAKLHEHYDKHGQKSQEGHVEENGEGKPPVTIQKGDADGYKTVTSDDQGNPVEQDHPDIHTAFHRVMAHFGEAKDPASDALDQDDDGPDGDNDADDQMDSGDVGRSDSGAY